MKMIDFRPTTVIAACSRPNGVTRQSMTGRVRSLTVGLRSLSTRGCYVGALQPSGGPAKHSRTASRCRTCDNLDEDQSSMRDAPLRIRIMGVRRTALAAALAALVAVPFGLVALHEEGSQLKDVVVRGPVASAPAGATRPSKATGVPIAPTPYEVNGSVAERARSLPNADLAQLAKTGTTLEKLAAIHVLWNRGRRSEVEVLVAEAGSRELTAKLSALRARTK